jgi:YbgC/YbaW family acyl-CoA thioester hydrolase
MGERARIRLKVRHHEVDAYGHVNHAHYVHYLETARVEVLESLGLGLPEMRQQGYLILAAELAIKYHAPAYAAETLEVVTHIREIRGARSVWIQEIREIASGRLVVTAEVTGAFTAATGRPVRIPAAFAEALSAIVVPDAAVPGGAPTS